MTFRRPWALLAALGVVLTAAGARAQVIETTETAPPPVPAATGAPRWVLAAGVRTLYIKGAAFDPFSSNDAFVQFSLWGTGAVFRRDALSLSAGAGLDAGSSSDQARGLPASLALTRVSAVVEGRVDVAPRLYAFARLAPGILHGSARIDDPSSPAGSSLAATFTSFSLDAGAGAALRLTPAGRRPVAAWLVADGGYGWAPAHALVLAPSLGSDQDKAGSVDLGSLAARGGFFRISVALGYR